jgi:hypothetical protein
VENIAEIGPSGKGWLSKIPEGTLTVVVVLLASAASFGLGMLAEREMGEGTPIQIEQLDASTLPAAAGAAPVPHTVAPVPKTESVPTPPAKTSGKYVASKNGEKFYLPTCSTVKRIKEENKVWFDTEEEAMAAGFTPGANCPGL